MTMLPDGTVHRGSGGVGVLGRLFQGRRAYVLRETKGCDVCTGDLDDEYTRLVDVDQRAMVSACLACALLFAPEGAGRGRFKPVPDRYLPLPSFALSPPQWQSVQGLVNIAFFVQSSSLGRLTAFYPTTTGATESQLPPEAWDEIAAAYPEFALLEPDVEALAVAGPESFIVPVDICYDLAARLREIWSGSEGGPEVDEELAAFLTQVRQRAQAAPAAS